MLKHRPKYTIFDASVEIVLRNDTETRTLQNQKTKQKENTTEDTDIVNNIIPYIVIFPEYECYLWKEPQLHFHESSYISISNKINKQKKLKLNQ